MDMSSGLSLDSVSRRIDSFTAERDWNQFHSIKNLVSSVSIEAAELCETIQWTNPSAKEISVDTKLQNSISEELADVMIYCIRLCSVLNLNLLEIINDKIDQNITNYPVEKSRGNFIKHIHLRDEE